MERKTGNQTTQQERKRANRMNAHKQETETETDKWGKICLQRGMIVLREKGLKKEARRGQTESV